MAGGSKGIRAGAAYVEAWLEDSRLRRGLLAAQKRLRSFGATVAKIGAGLSAAGSAVAGPMLAAVQRFADQGDSLEKMAARTGASVEALSELNYAAGQSGSGASELEAGLRGLAKTMFNAAKGSKTASDLLDELGLSVKALEGLAPDEQFTLVADRLAQVEDPSRRAAMAMQVLGKAGQRLLPLMNGGAEGIAALRQEARDLGLTIKTEDAQAAAAFGDQLDRLWNIVGKGVFVIGAALAPTITEAVGKTLKFLTSIVQWIDANRTLVLTIFKVALGVVAVGMAITLLGGAIIGLGAMLGGIATVLSTVGTLVGVIGSALAWLVSPIGLVIGALGALAVWFFTSTEAGAAAIDWLAQKFAELQSFTVGVFNGIADALAAGNIALAARILWLALQVAFQKGVAALKSEWAEWKAFFLTVWNEAVYGLAGMFVSAWGQIQAAWVQGTSFLLNLWDTVVAQIISLWTSAQNTIGSFFVDVLAKVGVLDAETATLAKDILQDDTGGRARGAQSQADAAIAAREAERKAQLDAIAPEQRGMHAALAQSLEAEQAQVAADAEKSIAAAEGRLEAARAELAAATAQAKDERGAAGMETDQPALSERLQKLLDGSALAPATKALSSQGSFSALAAVRAFGATSAADRTAKATEETAKNTKALVKQNRPQAQFT